MKFDRKQFSANFRFPAKIPHSLFRCNIIRTNKSVLLPFTPWRRYAFSFDFQRLYFSWWRIKQNGPFYRLLFMKKPGLVACLSHFIDEKMTVKCSDEFSWSWFASDFSQAEIIDGNFRVIFDDTETASEFKGTLDSVQVS